MLVLSGGLAFDAGKVVKRNTTQEWDAGPPCNVQQVTALEVLITNLFTHPLARMYCARWSLCSEDRGRHKASGLSSRCSRLFAAAGAIRIGKRVVSLLQFGTSMGSSNPISPEWQDFGVAGTLQAYGF